MQKSVGCGTGVICLVIGADDFFYQVVANDILFGKIHESNFIDCFQQSLHMDETRIAGFLQINLGDVAGDNYF